MEGEETENREVGETLVQIEIERNDPSPQSQTHERSEGDRIEPNVSDTVSLFI